MASSGAAPPASARSSASTQAAASGLGSSESVAAAAAAVEILQDTHALRSDALQVLEPLAVCERLHDYRALALSGAAQLHCPAVGRTPDGEALGRLEAALDALFTAGPTIAATGAI